MSTQKKKSTLYYLMTLAYSLVALVIIYSCSADEYNFNETQTEEDANSEIRAFSSKTLNGDYTLIDSIADSDEFWEFQMSSKILADKFHHYTSTLNLEEYNKLMEKLNNDDYLEEFVNRANLENELKQMKEAKDKLLKHTSILRLSEDGRMQLFIQYADSCESTRVKLLKSRNEGGNSNRCEEQRQAAFAQAKASYDNAIIKCRTESSTNYCYTQALAEYNRDKRIADRDYEACIKS